MKKRSKKLLLGLIAMMLLVSFTVISNVEAATPTVFWASPTKAKQIGNPLITKSTITYKDLVNINKYFDGKAKNESIAAGIATSIITAPLKPYAAIPAGTAVSILTTYSTTKGDIVNKTLLNSNTTDKFEVTLTYNYYRKGSRDGMYQLNDIKIKKK